MELQAVTWKCNGLHVIRYITFVTLHAWLRARGLKRIRSKSMRTKSMRGWAYYPVCTQVTQILLYVAAFASLTITNCLSLTFAQKTILPQWIIKRIINGASFDSFPLNQWRSYFIPFSHKHTFLFLKNVFIGSHYKQRKGCNGLPDFPFVLLAFRTLRRSLSFLLA